ncbi:MAG: ATP-binding protein [Chloroflexi bacterium]|nr:ATP-binding protein [Chloroflexota bacterium]
MTDDTALTHPPRRARRRRKSELTPLGAAFPEVSPERRVDKRVTCHRDGCKTPVHVQTRERELPLAVTIKARQAAGKIPVYCDPCLEAIEQRQAADIEAEERREATEHRVEHSGIPRRWRAETWEGVVRDDARRSAVEAAQAWSLGEGSRGVLLHGTVGRGKTHIAAVAARQRCEISPVRWINLADLMFELSLPMSDKRRAQAIRSLDPEKTHSRTALVLDDLDKVRPTDFGVQPVYLAVNGWIEAQQPLLVTMNSDLDKLADDFGERFGEAIASRLAGYCDVHCVGGSDRRLV